MPDHEQSFRDREGKAQSLLDALTGFSPAFAPADTSLNASNFGNFISGVGASNTNVENLASNYTTNATSRVMVAGAVGAAITQALSYIKSNKAWDAQFKAAKAAADKFRGIRPPKSTAAPAPTTPPAPAARPRNKGEQAYVELGAHLATFITVATSCPGYAPPSAAISISTLNGLLSQFRGLNGFISQLDAQLTSAREARRMLYYEADGLEEKFQSVKNAVKGQYGQGSAQFGMVKAMKW